MLQTKGRLVSEKPDPIRSPFQRDRDRILHSNAFRRLKHKTQVFVAVEGDHYRTRLTHSLEVAQVARTLARALNLDEDLTEALALCHDFGHPPFGHVGEEALNASVLEAAPNSQGFEHNIQTLRLLTKLESRYAKHDGLNLCWETIEGTVKHNMPVPDLPYYQQLDKVYKLDLDKPPRLEAQIAALSDDIAYTAHDMDDGLRAGYLNPEQLATLPVFGALFAKAQDDYKGAADSKKIHQAVRRVIRILVMDLYAQGQQLSGNILKFSPDIAAALKTTKAFMYQNLYHHPAVLKEAEKGKKVVAALFEYYMQYPKELGIQNHRPHYRNVADYIAGMTDQFAYRVFDTIVT